MRLEQLQYAIEIANAHSISIAAESLFISQPALSRSIKSLEEELAIPLFFRTTTGVNLTKFGEKLLPQMQNVLDQVQILQQQANDCLDICPDHTVPTVLSIEMLPTIADSLLAPTLDQLAITFPAAEINVNVQDFSDSLSLPIASKADLIITMNVDHTLDKTIADSTLQIEPLFTESLTVVMAKTHELASKSAISLDDVLSYKLIVHDNGFRPEDFYSKLTKRPQKLNIILKSNNPRVITQLLLKQNAVLLSNNLLSKNDYLQNDDLTIVPLKNLTSQYVCLYPADHPDLCLIKELISTLKFVRSKIVAPS